MTKDLHASAYGEDNCSLVDSSMKPLAIAETFPRLPPGTNTQSGTLHAKSCAIS
jgi:hypothetical protein